MYKTIYRIGKRYNYITLFLCYNESTIWRSTRPEVSGSAFNQIVYYNEVVCKSKHMSVSKEDFYYEC